jgi:hypothetical protein
MGGITQRREVLDHLLEYGSITSWEAIEKFHITRLSEYIRVLRSEGKNIESEWEQKGDKKWVRYVLSV